MELCEFFLLHLLLGWSDLVSLCQVPWHRDGFQVSNPEWLLSSGWSHYWLYNDFLSSVLIKPHIPKAWHSTIVCMSPPDRPRRLIFSLSLPWGTVFNQFKYFQFYLLVIFQIYSFLSISSVISCSMLPAIHSALTVCFSLSILAFILFGFYHLSRAQFWIT